MRRPSKVLWVSLVALGCSSRRANEAATDAAVVSAPVARDVVATGPRARAIVDGLREVPSLATRIGAQGAVARIDRGFVLDRAAPGTVAAGGAVLQAIVPPRASGAVHVARADRPGVHLDVRTALRDVAGEPLGGAVVYPDAALDTDVLQVLDAARVEELRVLRTDRAPTSWTWSLSPGPAVTELRLRDGRVEVLEGTEVRLVSDPIVAFDANDQRRLATVSLEKTDSGWRLAAALDTTGLAYPIALDPGWTRTFAKMGSNRHSMMAVALNDGRVAVMPGAGATAFPSIYDPITDKFTDGAATTGARWRAAAVRLGGSNKVLLFGGSFGFEKVWEIWDPIAGSGASSTLPVNLDSPLVTVLPSGKVFGYAQAAGAIFDPSTSTWTATATNPRSHNGGSVVALPSGKVMVTGGCCNTAIADLYDPTTDTWSVLPSMVGARSGHTMHVLSTGKVLIAGSDSGDSNRGNIYDPVANTFTAIPKTDAPFAFSGQKAVTLPSGTVFMVMPNGATLLYDETTGFSAGPSASMSRGQPGIALVPGGRVLIAGGDAGSAGVDISNNTAELWTPTAKTCTTATECASGHCVDGYCCDRTCGEQCHACDVPGREGFCSAVTGAPPHGARTSCAPYLNCYDGKCTGGCSSAADCTAGSGCLYGTCATKLADGTGCFDGSDCTSGTCVDGVCCDSPCTDQCKACDVAGSLGKCVTVTGAPHGTRTSCAPYVCGAGACLTGCTSDVECSATNYCGASGTCVPRESNGKACTRATECASGFCVDGYCCNVACDAACKTCGKVGSLGTCTNVAAGAADPRSLCVGECANGCTGTACSWKPSTTPCGQSCLDHTLTSGGRCSGTSERCDGATTLACAGGLRCQDGKTCKTTCTTGEDCVSGICDVGTGACGAAPADAGPDADAGADATTGADDATTDATTDTALDDTTVDSGTEDVTVDSGAEDVATDTLAIAETPAPPVDETPKLPVEVKTCTKDEECATGFCVEGVCCDSRCDQRCHSCALLSNPGKCTPEPIGVDLKQECGPAFTCLGTCGPGGECIGAGKGTMCARNRCTGPSNGVGPAYCAAAGAKCGQDDGVPFDCEPFACAPAFGACLTSCASSDDCANGYVCDVPSRTCVAPVAPADDSGCAVSAPGRSSFGAGSLAFAALAIAGVASRRRRARV